MTLQKLCIMLYSIFALIGSANAGPITIYYDPAAWLAAINAFGPVTIGPYSGSVTITDIITTLQTDPNGHCCHITMEPSTSSSDNFHQLEWGWTQLGDALDIDGGSCVFIPNCAVSAPTERIINFNPGIVGFYSLGATIPIDTTGWINGEAINGYIHPVYNGFLGVVGATAVLDFSSDCAGCDTFSYIFLDNIQVAIPTVNISEPSTLACLFSAFLTLSISASRLKRRG